MDKSLLPVDCNFLTSRRMARHVSRIYERHMAPAKITSTQYAVLSFVQDFGALSVAQICDLMVMDRTSLLRTLQSLEREALILAVRKPGDGRRLTYSLTPKGVFKVSEGAQLWRAAQQEYEAAVGVDRAAVIRAELHAVVLAT